MSQKRISRQTSKTIIELSRLRKLNKITTQVKKTLLARKKIWMSRTLTCKFGYGRAI